MHTYTHAPHAVLGEIDAIKRINADFLARPPETSRTLSVSGGGGRREQILVDGLTER